MTFVMRTNDTLYSSDPHSSQRSTENQSKSRPQLPLPHINWNAFQKYAENQEGLISIICEVLALKAKIDSNFLSLVWRQACVNMQREAALAPVIGESIQSQDV